MLSAPTLAIRHLTPITIIQIHLMIHQTVVHPTEILCHLQMETSKEEVRAAAMQMPRVEAAHLTDHQRPNHPVIVPAAIHQTNQTQITKMALFKCIKVFRMYFMYNFVYDHSSTNVQAIKAAVAIFFHIIA